MRVGSCLVPSLILSLLTKVGAAGTTLRHYKPALVVGDTTPTATRPNTDSLMICLLWCKPDDGCFIVIYDSANQECKALDQYLLATPMPDESGTPVYANVDYRKFIGHGG